MEAGSRLDWLRRSRSTGVLGTPSPPSFAVTGASDDDDSALTFEVDGM